MALAYRQVKYNTGIFNTTGDVTLDSALNANPNMLAFIATFGANAAGSSSADDNINSPYTREIVSPGNYAAFFSKIGSSAGTPVVTVNPNTGDWYGYGGIEFNGTSVEVNDTASNNATGATTQNSGSVTTTADCIVFGLLHSYSSETFTADGAWTEIAVSTDLGFQPYRVVYRTGGSGTYNPQWTTSNGVTYEGVTIAFIEGGGGGGGLTSQLLTLGVG